MGEYGHLLLAPPPSRAVEDITGPMGEVRAPADLLRLCERLLHLFYANSETKGMVRLE